LYRRNAAYAPRTAVRYPENDHVTKKRVLSAIGKSI